MRILPRRAIDVPKVDPEYRKEVTRVETKKIKNTKQWHGVVKEPLPENDPQLSVKRTEFQAATKKLKSLVDPGGLVIGHRDLWARNQKAREARGDLAAYWNDAKFELASRMSTLVDGPAKAAVQKTLEWLEMAEREGGLGTWLEAWNAAANSTFGGRRDGASAGAVNRSWLEFAEAIQNISTAIEFCKEIIKDGLGTLVTDPNFNSPLEALDAIGSEIARQAEEIASTGRCSKPPEPFEIIRERFKLLSERILVSDRLRAGVENAKSQQAFTDEIPDNVRQVIADKLKEAEGCLALWDQKVNALRELLKKSKGDGSEAQLAGVVSYACKELKDRLWELCYVVRHGVLQAKFRPEEASLALNANARVAEEIAAQLERLAYQCDFEIREDLLATAEALRGIKDRAKDQEPDNSIWYFCRKAKEQGKLPEFWIGAKKGIDKALREPASGMYNIARADMFAAGTRDELESLLSCWTNRNDPAFLATMQNKLSELGIPLDLENFSEKDFTYTLGWKLIASLRQARQLSEALFANLPQPLATLNSSLDSLAQIVFEDLPQSVRAANA
jgi:hypothetical protein